VSRTAESRIRLGLIAALLAGLAFVSPAGAAGRKHSVDPAFEWPAQGRLVVPLCRRTGNKGIDLAVPAGAEIHAAESGRVAYAGSELREFPNLILLAHAGGWVSAYAFNDEIFVKRGDVVKRGQVIAAAGGGIGGRLFHFELRRREKAVDPLIYLRPKAAAERASFACASQ
jgi:murein DD-endopeptidase MepM/ murein hydrolase activator NlpD